MTESTPPAQIEAKTKPLRKVSLPAILLRLFLSAVVGTIVGAVIYFAAIGSIPYIEQRVFEPIDQNRENQQALETQLANLQSEVLLYQDALATLEMESAQAVELGDTDRATRDANSQLLLSQTLAIGTLDSKITSLNSNLSALATAQMRISDLSLNYDLLRIADLLILANQHILHADYGRAKIELDLARIELESLLSQSPPHFLPYLEEILDLTQDAIAGLPADYLLAAAKIELARQLVWQGFPGLPGTFTPTPAITSTPTPNS